MQKHWITFKQSSCGICCQQNPYISGTSSVSITHTSDILEDLTSSQKSVKLHPKFIIEDLCKDLWLPENLKKWLKCNSSQFLLQDFDHTIIPALMSTSKVLKSATITLCFLCPLLLNVRWFGQLVSENMKYASTE